MVKIVGLTMNGRPSPYSSAPLGCVHVRDCACTVTGSVDVLPTSTTATGVAADRSSLSGLTEKLAAEVGWRAQRRKPQQDAEDFHSHGPHRLREPA